MDKVGVVVTEAEVEVQGTVIVIAVDEVAVSGV
jgi:hypothetical protein